MMNVIGCTVQIQNNHPVMSFMDLFFANIRDNMNLYYIMSDTLQKYPEVWNDNINRQMVLNIFIIIGTNMLLKGHDISWASCISQGIISIENYEGGTCGIDSAIWGRVVSIKRRDLDPGCSSNRRDILKFYRKRTTCKCLKKLHLEARKTMPKTGTCWYCNQEKERVLLDVCSRCMIYQYCSRECQVAHWSAHERDCYLHVKAHELHS